MIQYPQRTVEGNFVVSSAMPALRVQLDNALKYVGNLKSTVNDSIHIDNYFFVEDDDNGGIERIVYLQFEGYLPDKDDEAQQYSQLNKTIQIAERKFSYNGGVRPYRQAKIDAQAEDSDIRQAVAFLNEHGLSFKELEFYGTLQFLHFADADKRNKLHIVYLEHLEEADIPEDVIAHSRESEDWATYCEKFLSRAMRSFTVCE